MKKGKSGTVGLVLFFVAMIAMVGTIAFRNYDTKPEEEKTKEEQMAENSPYEDEYVAADTGENAGAEETGDVQSTSTEHVTAEIEEKPVIEDKPSTPASSYTFSDSDKMIWPIDGNVLMNYSMDETIYFATLEQYKYNPAIIIGGVPDQKVLATTDGKVTAISVDPQIGNMVTVDMGNGYQAIYGQLGKVNVVQGDSLHQGDLIGVLGEPTKYYSVEGYNLFFQVLKDGEPVNPLNFLY